MDINGQAANAKMVRIGAFDYEPPRVVKMHTLDYLVETEQGKKGQTVDHKKIKEN